MVEQAYYLIRFLPDDTKPWESIRKTYLPRLSDATQHEEILNKCGHLSLFQYYSRVLILRESLDEEPIDRSIIYPELDPNQAICFYPLGEEGQQLGETTDSSIMYVTALTSFEYTP